MTFTDLFFLFVFLPLSWMLYRFFLSGKQTANLSIFILSLVFYAWGSIQNLIILLLVLFMTWLGAAAIDQAKNTKTRKQQLIATCVFCLLLLFVYRYLPVWFSFLPVFAQGTPSRLVMPVGLSFYLFSTLSYVFDVYMKKAEPLSSFVDYGVYAAFFGRINMGPIAHYAKFKDQIFNHPVNRRKTAIGVQLFLQGLFYKVVLADSLAAVYTLLQTDTSWVGNLLFGFSFFFQLYFDFAGYSRMARGIGYLFGFEIPRNFNLPYTATSVQDFWRRWHISLTDWFRDYIYIPLGGNRVNTLRWVMNILVVWLLTGLWHGATWTFIFWGLFQGLMILFERFVFRPVLDVWPSFCSHIYLVLSQLIGWTLFSSATIGSALKTIGRYFGIGITSFGSTLSWFALKDYAFLWIAAILIASGCTILLARMMQRLLKKNFSTVQTAWYLGGFALCVTVIVSSTSQTFLYAAF